MTNTIPRTASAAAEAVRTMLCPLCWAADGKQCRRRPAGDHLARYLAAYRERVISRDQLKAAIGLSSNSATENSNTGAPSPSVAVAAARED